MEISKTVDEYIQLHPQWQEELLFLRKIMNSTELTETVKWGAPVYTINGKNIVGLGAFKSYVGIWFFQGVYLKDEKKKLINAQEGKTQAQRQWRFNHFDEIDEVLITKYVEEAIANQKAGKELKPQKKPLIIPKQLQFLLDKNEALASNFESMTLTKKREFAEYIADAKQEGTKLKRLERIIPMILKNKGLNDKYR